MKEVGKMINNQQICVKDGKLYLVLILKIFCKFKIYQNKNLPKNPQNNAYMHSCLMRWFLSSLRFILASLNHHYICRSAFPCQNTVIMYLIILLLTGELQITYQPSCLPDLGHSLGKRH